MKKRNFITGFSAAFVALITLASCGGIRAKDGVVLTINGKQYTAEELFDDQKTPAAAEAKFNSVYKVAVRRYFEVEPGLSYMTDITRDTKNKVAGAKAEAQSNADKNGTKYATEWEKILSTNGVDDETGLYNKFEYDLQKEKFEDVFYENNYDVLRKGGYFHEKGGDGTIPQFAKQEKLEKGYLQEKQPYHMKHILVKVSAKSGDNATGEITADEAEKIYHVVKELAEGTSFEQVSKIYNDDATAKKSNGSLGIMSRDTSFVNDFKLGTYMYEAFFGTSTQNEGTAYEGNTAITALGLYGGTAEGTSAKDYAYKISKFDDPTTSIYDTVTTTKGIGQIPYGEVLKLAKQKDGGVGDLDFNDPKGNIQKNFTAAGLSSSDVKAKYYPRNVIFNKYFNKHNIMVITPTNAPSLDFDEYVNVPGTGGSTRKAKKDIYYDKTIESTYSALSGFDESKKKNDDEIVSGLLPNTANNVLRDDNGRIILVFRSGSGSSSNSNDESGYQGIHFVVIERSPFIASETEGTKGSTSLEEYYTEYYPMQENTKHPKYDGGDYKYTYTNYIANETEIVNQKARADTVKSELKKANDNLNTYIYDYLVGKGELTFGTTATAKGIKDSIDTWIKYTKRAATEEEKEKKWDDTWETYYNSLEAQYEQRKENLTSSTVISRLIPEVCVVAFQKDSTELKDLFGTGGVFHD